jgi:hypothetical protein
MVKVSWVSFYVVRIVYWKVLWRFHRLVTVCWVCGFDAIRVHVSWHHFGRMQELMAHESAFWIVCVFVLFWNMPVNFNVRGCSGWLLSIVCTLSIRGSIPGKGMRFFLPFPKNPDRLWGSLSLLFSGHRAIFPGLKGGGRDLTTSHCQR